MKIAFSNISSTIKNNSTIIAPIPLKAAESSSPKEKVKFDVRSIPTNQRSETFAIEVHTFSSGTPEELIVAIKNWKRVCQGNNVTTAAGKALTLKNILRGMALTNFELVEKTFEDQKVETEEQLQLCVDNVFKKLFPSGALQAQKKYMRRSLRKPRDMLVREYAARIQELNEYLVYFPGGGTKLDDDQVKEIFETSIPNKWKSELMLHKLDSAQVNVTLQDMLDHCEILETQEALENRNGPRGNRPREGRKPKSDPLVDAKSPARAHHQNKRTVRSGDGGNDGNFRQKKRNEAQGKWCPLHQTEKHDMNECKVMLNQAKNMRGMYEANKGGASGRNQYKEDKKLKEQVFAMVDKALKKRKRNKDKEAEDSTDEESSM